MQAKDHIICALDVDDVCRAVELVEQLNDHVGLFKVGLELVTAAGVQVFAQLRAAGADRLFYDAKLHDIPNTIAGAMRSVARLGVWGVTVHAVGGSAMLHAAVETGRQAAEAQGLPRPRVLAVTVLTSLSAQTLREDLCVGLPMTEYVIHLANLAYEAGCDGVITSPREIEAVRRAIADPAFLIVTPGVRPAGAETGDQARVMTPAEAMRHGVDYMVIGRPIVAAPDPVAAARQIAVEIAGA